MEYPFEHELYAPAARIADILGDAHDIVIASHANPDGDALGAMYALAYGLTALGKRTALCNATGVPNYLAWLTSPSPVHRALADVPFAPRLAVILDCADASRLGRELLPHISTLPTINIDHHVGNPRFGNVDNWVEPHIAATGQMVAAILHALDVPLTGAIADALYVSISTDTGDFTFDNVSAEVLDLLASMMRLGLRIAPLRQYMDNQWPLCKMRLWGKALAHVSLHEGGRVALVALSQADIQACEAGKEDGEGLVEHIRRLRGVDVAAFVREDSPEKCKISLRSHGSINVQAMTARFGGGGHINAAGATLEMPFAEAIQATLATVSEGLGTPPAHIGRIG